MFNVLSELGEGSFGDVHLVENKQTKEKFALKSLNKDFMIKMNRIDNVYKEKRLMFEASQHPNIVSLRASFQDDENLYYLLDLCEKGSLGTLLHQHSKYKKSNSTFH